MSPMGIVNLCTLGFICIHYEILNYRKMGPPCVNLQISKLCADTWATAYKSCGDSGNQCVFISCFKRHPNIYIAARSLKWPI